MKVSEVLTCARAKIADPKNWTKDAYARDAGGAEIEFWAPTACQWCASGAISACDDGAALKGSVDHRNPFYFMARSIPSWNEDSYETIPGYNDAADRTHGEILALFDKAITLALEHEQAVA